MAGLGGRASFHCLTHLSASASETGDTIRKDYFSCCCGAWLLDRCKNVVIHPASAAILWNPHVIRKVLSIPHRHANMGRYLWSPSSFSSVASFIGKNM
jgi:hypothetical protein